MINLELYRIFYVVAEEKNITRASEILNISQPAVTKQIKNLESLLNTPLFIRTKKGVTLNEIGQKIYLNVKQALTLLDETNDFIKEYSTFNKGTIKIGTSTTLMRKYLLNYIEKYHNKYPNIVFDIYTDPTKELINRLKNGNIDLVIGKKPEKLDNDITYKELSTTNYIFVANPKYFNINKVLKPTDLINYPILLQEYPSNSRDNADIFFKENNIDIEPKMSIASSNLLLDFIKMGYGIGYVTKLYVKDELNRNELIEIKLTSPPKKVSFGIISLRNNITSNPCKKLIEIIKD